MAVSSFSSSAGSSAAASFSNFTVSITSVENTTVPLNTDYPAGRYDISFSGGDTSYDIYAISKNGLYAGYSNGSSIEISAIFDKVVVLGADLNEKITFTYNGAVSTPTSSGDAVVAGAFISTIGTPSLPNAGDTTLITGGNFAEDVQVEFIGQNNVPQSAKAITRISSTQLNATRPDSFDVSNSPYTVSVSNPGIPAPAGTDANLVVDGVSAGTVPSWITGTSIFYNLQGQTTATVLEAADSEESAITYSLASGTLPAGLSLNSNGTIEGIFSGSASEGAITAITVRATDAGGNFVDKSFNLTANDKPVWVTSSLPEAGIGTSYSQQLSTSTGSAGGDVSYSLESGSLPAGLSLDVATGVISGASSADPGTTATFTIRATDSAGAFATQELSILTSPPLEVSGGTLTSDATYYYRTFSSSSSITVTGGPLSCDVTLQAGGGGGGASGSGGGGGGGGCLTYYGQSINTTSFSIGGGAGAGGTGGGTSMTNVGSVSGGGSGGSYTGGGSGGSGGGGASTNNPRSGGPGIAGQGNSGGSGANSGSGAGGGGAGGGGANGSGSIYVNASGGSARNVFGMTFGGGGAGGSFSNTNDYRYSGGGFGGGGSGGFNGNNGAGGNPGRVVVRYLRSLVD